MWIDRAVKWLLPREDRFFELLERGAGLTRDVGGLLAECCAAEPGERKPLVERMHDLEHQSDDVIAEVYEALNSTFVTPMDRSDIYQLASALEGIVDHIFGTALQFVVHAIEDLPPGSCELAGLVCQAAETIDDAVRNLRDLKKAPEIRACCERLTRLETEGDRIYRDNLAAMFRSESDPIRLIKHKEFLEGLEKAIDGCEDVGDALLTIVIKNA